MVERFGLKVVTLHRRKRQKNEKSARGKVLVDRSNSSYVQYWDHLKDVWKPESAKTKKPFADRYLVGNDGDEVTDWLEVKADESILVVDDTFEGKHTSSLRKIGFSLTPCQYRDRPKICRLDRYSRCNQE